MGGRGPTEPCEDLRVTAVLAEPVPDCYFLNTLSSQRTVTGTVDFSGAQTVNAIDYKNAIFDKAPSTVSWVFPQGRYHSVCTPARARAPLT